MPTFRASRLFNESDRLKLPSPCRHDGGLRRLRDYSGITCGLGLVCLLAVLAGTASGASELKRAVFGVTLQATVTKDWNAVTETTEDGCPVSRQSVGRRTISLRSIRPSRVVVTFGSNRVSYSPTIVRSVAIRLTQNGNRTTRVMAPCPVRTVRSRCARMQRLLSGARFRFFRSARNEISFRPARLPEFGKSCPVESADVRAIRPSLRDAQGGITEQSLANPRIHAQTSLGSVEVTTDLEGEETGRVVERVHWALTFTRRSS